MPTIHTTTIIHYKVCHIHIPYDIWKVRYRFRGNITAKNRSTAIAVKVKTELAIESNRVNGMILHKMSENVPFDQSIICPVTSRLMVAGMLKAVIRRSATAIFTMR